MSKLTGKPNGRPLMFKSAKELQGKIDKYFTKCDTNTLEVYSKSKEEIIEMNRAIPYTIEGLCNALNMTRQSLLNYSNKEEFFDTIKKAKQEILANQVDAGMIGTADKTMTIFLLKNNHNYADKTEVRQDIELKVKSLEDFYK